MQNEATTPPEQLDWYRASMTLEGQRIVDVGANVGVLSAFFWEQGGGSLLSVEPLEENVARIEEARGRLGSPAGWRVERGAVSGRRGEVRLRAEAQADGSWNSVVTRGEGRVVPCHRLVELAPDATVVKLDIEGHEFEVLEDSVAQMKQVRAWAIEFHQVEGHPLEAALGLLAGAGYSLVAAGRKASDPRGAWVSAPIPPTLSWAQIPAGRGRDGTPFRMLHVLARR
jgi:FkbM family methyltransferase